jgi:Fe-S-cluster containining protein
MNQVTDKNNRSCRAGCGACCIAPSISSFIPGMPEGKPAGVRCVQLTPDNHCVLFGRPERPAVCSTYSATEEFCGTGHHDALKNLQELELRTGS